MSIDVGSESLFSSMSGKAKLFSCEDTESLANLCADIIKNPPITQARIERVLKRSRDGLIILKNYSLDQLVNKVKYERRMFIKIK